MLNHALKAYNSYSKTPLDFVTPGEHNQLKDYLPEPVSSTDNLTEWEAQLLPVVLHFMKRSPNNTLHFHKDIVKARRAYAQDKIIPIVKERAEAQTKGKKPKASKDPVIEARKALSKISPEHLRALLNELE